MIWNDRKINHVGADMIQPFVGEQVRELDGRKVVSYGVSSFGYDVRLGVDFLRVCRPILAILDPKVPASSGDAWCGERADPLGGKGIVIEPGECVLGATLEKVRMPENVMALCLGKSTYARLGLVVNATPLEPGWVGHITLELSNTNRVPIRVWPMEGIAQLIFFEGERPMTTYADKRGKYQDQAGVPVRAKV
jgi:dCTP deaminase